MPATTLDLAAGSNPWPSGRAHCRDGRVPQGAHVARSYGAHATANSLPRDGKSAKPVLVPLEVLHPTQVAVGMRAVAWKRRKVERRAGRSKQIERFLGARPIPSVVGPEGALYMIDSHHLGLALWQAEVEKAYVSIIDDLSRLPKAQFWRRMEASGRLYPFDEEGRRVRPSRLPGALHALREDPFRDLAWSVREAGGFAKSPVPFAEFRWAEFFRAHLSERTLRRDYERAVARALKLSRCPEARGLPGYVHNGSHR